MLSTDFVNFRYFNCDNTIQTLPEHLQSEVVMQSVETEKVFPHIMFHSFHRQQQTKSVFYLIVKYVFVMIPLFPLCALQ